MYIPLTKAKLKAAKSSPETLEEQAIDDNDEEDEDEFEVEDDEEPVLMATN